jgi:hypothetical protein
MRTFGPHVALDRREQEALAQTLPHLRHIIAEGASEPRARHVLLGAEVGG